MGFGNFNFVWYRDVCLGGYVVKGGVGIEFVVICYVVEFCWIE